MPARADRLWGPVIIVGGVSTLLAVVPPGQVWLTYGASVRQMTGASPAAFVVNAGLLVATALEVFAWATAADGVTRESLMRWVFEQGETIVATASAGRTFITSGHGSKLTL